MSINGLCRNGSDCYFLKIGTCWFKHAEAKPMKEKTEGIEKNDKSLGKAYWKSLLEAKVARKEINIDLNSWEDWQLVKGPFDAKKNIVNIMFDDDYEEMEDSEEESSSDSEDGGDELFKCSCNHTEEAFNPLLEQIFALPPEIMLKIFRMLDFERLLSLELSADLLKDVLQVSGAEDLDRDNLLRTELYRKNLGIIFIPDGTSLYLSNEKGWNCDCYHYSSRAGPMNLKKINPGLKPGFYKVRQLEKGFDLAKVGQQFISTQCGPRQCFPTACHKREWGVEQVGNWAWATSFMSRGFRVETENRPDLAAEKFMRRNFSCNGGRCCEEQFSSSDCDSTESESLKVKHISRRAEWSELGLSGSIFIISLEDGWWSRRWTIKERKSYCQDDVTTALEEESGYEHEPRLSVITSGCCDGVGHMCQACTRRGVKVVAYVLSNYDWRAEGGFCSFNPRGLLPENTEADIQKCHDLYEEDRSFHITRYGCADEEDLSGFILTGDLNYYARPAELLEDGEDFPDRQFYEEEACI